MCSEWNILVGGLRRAGVAGGCRDALKKIEDCADSNVLGWNIFSRVRVLVLDFQLILPKLKYFLIWSKSGFDFKKWFRFFS